MFSTNKSEKKLPLECTRPQKLNYFWRTEGLRFKSKHVQTGERLETTSASRLYVLVLEPRTFGLLIDRSSNWATRTFKQVRWLTQEACVELISHWTFNPAQTLAHAGNKDFKELASELQAEFWGVIEHKICLTLPRARDRPQKWCENFLNNFINCKQFYSLVYWILDA